MKALEGLENSLNDVFGKSAPQLPKGFKDFIVKIVPWLTLLGGLIGLWLAYAIYRWTTATNGLTDLANEISIAYGGGKVVQNDWTLPLILAVVMLLLMTVIYLLAFSPLQKLQKKGWDLLFYAMLINLVYGVIIAFTDYGNAGNIISSLIGFAIGAYFLFQIRDYYLGKVKVSPPPKTSSSDAKN